MKNKKFLKILFLLTYLLTYSLTHCLYGIDIYLELKSKGERVGIFINKMDNSEVSSEIAQIVANDLSYSGNFDVIADSMTTLTKEFDFSKTDRDTMIIKDANTVVKFETELKSDKILVTAYCWDVGSAKKIFDKKYKYDKREIRKLAHNLSQDIVEYITGQQMKFSSKIAFCSTLSGHKEIWCIDYDGKNLKQLTYHKSISILPKFSHDGRYIFYTTYKNNNPDVFRYDFEKAESTPFLTYQGINIPGSVSPDGKYFIATLSKSGDPEIYLFASSGRLIRRLTYSSGVDTAASFSPNSQEFVFVSDRSGNPQLFVMDIDGTNLRRMTHSGYNDSPSWSPIGDKIVFTRKHGSVFDIYILDVAEKKEYRLTENSGSNENPSFSFDGRHIVFSSNRNGTYTLFTMSSSGSNQKQLGVATKDSTNPTWSP
ncbi:MAG: PD40 domain-containing protein [Elusimicrobia bacterium]|nr:PD40 domain-containing protein [Elusimicrobiota bacterium]